jgi:mannose PTS system EIIA component
MIGILVVAHGGFAHALVSSVQFIVGKLRKTRCVSIRRRDTEVQIKRRIEKEISELEEGDGVLVLTDIFGGTPTNLSTTFLGKQNVEVVTGVNIPMLLTVSSYRSNKSLDEISKMVKEAGQKSIILAREAQGCRDGMGNLLSTPQQP